MKVHAWNEEKNLWLKEHRNISFEAIIEKIERKEGFVTIIDHPNQNKHPGQRMYVVEINRYCFLVPFVEDAQKVFLKTIYPSRGATEKYLRKEVV